jgi:hypothetical protein
VPTRYAPVPTDIGETDMEVNDIFRWTVCGESSSEMSHTMERKGIKIEDTFRKCRLNIVV